MSLQCAQSPKVVKKAIEGLTGLQKILVPVLSKLNYENLGPEDAEEFKNHLGLAIEALEKQLPKKPAIEKWEPARCPCCDTALSESRGDGYYKHWISLNQCPQCGQNLEWD